MRAWKLRRALFSPSWWLPVHGYVPAARREHDGRGSAYPRKIALVLGRFLLITPRTITLPRTLGPGVSGEPFSEQHRQYFHTDADVRAALREAGFTVTAVSEEYTHHPADAATLRATWTARRLARTA